MTANEMPYVNVSDNVGTPKAPALQIILTDRTASKCVPLLALLDSGGDGTFVRWEKMQELQDILQYELPQEGIEYIQNGEMTKVYEASLMFGKTQLFPNDGIDCPKKWSYGKEEAIIGRDILNQLVILLNGPREKFTIQLP